MKIPWYFGGALPRPPIRAPQRCQPGASLPAASISFLTGPSAFTGPFGQRLESLVEGCAAATSNVDPGFVFVAGSPNEWPLSPQTSASARTFVWFSALTVPDHYDRARQRFHEPTFLHGDAGLSQLETILAGHGVLRSHTSVDIPGGDALFELKGVYLQQLVLDFRAFMQGCPDEPIAATRAWRTFLQRVEGSAGTYEFNQLSEAANRARTCFDTGSETAQDDAAATLLTEAINAAVAQHREQLSARLPQRIARDVRHRALILASDPNLAQQLRLALTHSELEAHIHDAPETFVEALRAVHPDVVVMQEDLGAFDGFDIAAQVLSLPEFSALPIIGLIDDAAESTRTRAARCGIDSWLVRPFSAENAIRTVGAVLRRADAQVALGGRDAVTGLFSRRALFDRLELELLRSRRASQRVVLMLIHIEEAPRDRYPRQLLLELARTVETNFRRSDLLGRYNERTIAAVLPGADPRVVSSLIDRLLEAVDPRIRLRISASIAEGSVAPAVVAADAETRLIQALDGQPGSAIGRCASADNAEQRSDSPRILLVDNDEAIITLLKFFCQREGYVVEEARDGLSAIEQLEAADQAGDLPDLVILEAYLPGVDGFSVLRKIQSAYGSRVSVMMLTIQRNEERIAKAFNLGAADFVAKPFSVPEVMARIQNILVRAGAI